MVLLELRSALLSQTLQTGSDHTFMQLLSGDRALPCQFSISNIGSSMVPVSYAVLN